MNGCLFCKIVAGEIPAFKVYEDGSLIAFLDIKPVNKGHTLIVPKEHYATMLDVPAHVLSDMMSAVPSIAKAVMKATQSTGFNLLVNTNPSSGQLVEHVHMHIIPRFEGDGYRHWVGKHYESDAQANEVLNAVRAALS